MALRNILFHGINEKQSLIQTFCTNAWTRNEEGGGDSMMTRSRQATEYPESVSAPPEPAPARILVIEDSPDLRKALQLLLGPKYETISIASGEGFFEEIDSYRPNLIIMDVVLPGKDGFQLCEMLRASPRHRHLPVLFLTAKKDTNSYIRCLNVYGDAYVNKPFAPKELIGTIERLLRR